MTQSAVVHFNFRAGSTFPVPVCNVPHGHWVNKADNQEQLDSSTIDGNVEFVHSQYSCILTSQVSNQFLCPTKLKIKVIILE